MIAIIVPAGGYPYIRDLLALDGARQPEISSLHPDLQQISSPLTERLPAWRSALAAHPDHAFSRYVLDGIEHGFRVGFDHTFQLTSAVRNMPSAAAHPSVISEYIAAERGTGRMLGPYPPGSVPDLHINRMGVVPKGHVPGRWRLITDLSFPEGASVNDGISRVICLKYTSVEAVATAAGKLGKGALLAKLDIKSAYRLVPVHPDDRPLLGIRFEGACYVDGALPFGLRSAPKIFTAVADALQYVVRSRGVSAVDHYLDDFITWAPAGLEECAANLSVLLATCKDLGVPLAADKLEGPSSRLTFLGIEIDTEAGVLRLPEDKLVRLRGLLSQWHQRRSCRRRQLESLVGSLHHACCVVRPGRAFLRRVIDLLRIPGASRSHHHVRLNKQFRADLAWWQTFAAHWNGIAIFPIITEPTIEVTSDASGRWGCGAWSSSSWLQMEWPPGAREHSISFKELFAGLVATAVWGRRWKNCRVRWRCDNQPVVYAVNRRSCRDEQMMKLIRCLFFFEAWFGFEIIAEYLPGRENILADDLSRNRRFAFLSKARQPDIAPAALPEELPELLLDPDGWTSPRWTERFYDMLTAV